MMNMQLKHETQVFVSGSHVLSAAFGAPVRLKPCLAEPQFFAP